MNYEILESRIEFINNQISKITVLINCTGRRSKPYSDVRAIYATTKAMAGYMNIPPLLSDVSNDILQRVASGGTQTYDRDKIFPGWKKRLPSL